MPSKVEKIISKFGKKFNKQRAKLTPEGTKYVLYKNSGRTGDLTPVLELTEAYHEFDDWREKTNVMVGRNDPTFVRALYESSAIGIGAEFLLIYTVDKRDIAPPDGKRPWWDIFCSIEGGRIRYEQ